MPSAAASNSPLCADFRVGEGARLGPPEIMLGIIPGAGGTQRLTRLVGSARAKDIIYTGRLLPAAEARGNAQLHREWAGEGHLQRALT